MNSYISLDKQEYKLNKLRIVPIRFQDRFSIMKWRNEQMYHLRQQKPLTEEDQNNYFENVVSKLFEEEKPDQILFSYLENDTCVGYGGLVHINWLDKNAEISFIMDTNLEKKHFKQHWSYYLKLIEEVAFKELKLHKVYTYAFDLRPSIYSVFENNGYCKEAVLVDHKLINNQFINVIIHSKINYND